MIGVGLTFLFGLTDITWAAVILGASLPCSLMTMAYAREHGLDTGFLASMLSIALPISLGCSSLLLALLH